jgi:regulatory protein
MPLPSNQPSLKGRALRALAAREHSRVELQRKLQAHEQEPGELNKILDDLAAKGFISDARVADSLVHRRGQKLGAARVLQELRQKGVAPEALATAARQLQATELERAQEVQRKKFGESAPLDATERARQMRFLASRGFAPEVIRRLLRGDAE